MKIYANIFKATSDFHVEAERIGKQSKTTTRRSPGWAGERNDVPRRTIRQTWAAKSWLRFSIIEQNIGHGDFWEIITVKYRQLTLSLGRWKGTKCVAVF